MDNTCAAADGLSCETPAAPPVRATGAPVRQPKNSKRAHLRVPALQTPKFHERTPRERKKKERKLWREEGKKARNFGPTLQAPPFGIHPSGPHPSGLGNFKDVQFCPIFIFGHPLKDIRVFTPPDFFDYFGLTPFFLLSEALFNPKRRPKILNFLPHPKCWPFLGRPPWSPFTPKP